MADDCRHMFVLTGGPGSGKTTLIEALGRAGHATGVEAGRSIIRDQSAIGGNALPWADRLLYAELMLCWDMRSHHVARARSGPVFLDRGVPDTIGYLRTLGRPVPPHMLRAAESFRYSRRVFVAPPWPEIFVRDGERRQDLDEAERTHAAMVATYAGLGYELVTLPRAPVEERVRFILDAVGTTPPG